MEVLEHQAGVLLAGLLGDLPLDRGDHGGDAHLVLAPLAEGGGGAGAEQLHLVPKPLQRVAGDEESEHLFFLGQPLGLGPGGKVGKACGTLGFPAILPVFPVLPEFPVSPNNDPCPASRSACSSCASASAGSNASMNCLRWPPSESQAPAATSDSSTRLLQSRRSSRSTSSATDV